MLLIACLLAVWRITSLFTDEYGPFNVLFKLRKLSRHFGDLLDCFMCVSIYVAVPFSFLFHKWYIYIFALSAGAILINSFKDWLDN